MKKLFLGSSLLLGLISFSTAHAERIICKPVEVGLVKSVTIDSVSEKKNTMSIQYMDNSVAIGAAEYGDDVDAVFFFSKKLNAQLDYFWAEMQKNNQAHGSFYRDYPGSAKRDVIEVLCKASSTL